MTKKYCLFLLSGIFIFLFVLSSKLLAAGIPDNLFSIANVQIGVTTLDKIQKTYGTNAPYRISNEEEADVELCYSNNLSPERTFLIFESGIMGGYKEITGFRISTMHKNEKCKQTNLNIGTLSTGNGIYLGQSLTDFEKRFPFKFKRRGVELFYDTISQRKATTAELKRLHAMWPNEKQDYFDVTVDIKAIFKNDKLIDYYVHKIESY